jgi:hypothetical protein
VERDAGITSVHWGERWLGHTGEGGLRKCVSRRKQEIKLGKYEPVYDGERKSLKGV